VAIGNWIRNKTGLSGECGDTAGFIAGYLMGEATTIKKTILTTRIVTETPMMVPRRACLVLRR
jgi:hypothetical protein